METKTNISILCATDEGFAPYCGIMLTSLLDNNKESRLCVYVFVSDDFSQVNRRKYKSFEDRYDCSIILMEMDNRMVEGLPVFALHSITIPTYYRLFAARILPKEVSRIIYLDCDIIVRGSLKSMWDTEMGNQLIAGVKDCGPRNEEMTVRLGYPSSYGYFNAGAVLINLDAWRKSDIDEQIMPFVKEHQDHLLYMDQDVLNGLMHSRKVLLPIRYNFQTQAFRKHYWVMYTETDRASLREEMDTAVIIHYCGNLKPWHFMYKGGAFYADWEKYRRISDWRCCRKRRPFKKYVKQVVKRNLFPTLWQKQVNALWAL